MNTNKMLRLKKLLRSVILAMLLLSAQIPPQVLAAVINGTNGPDTITGTEEDDMIDARNGDDTVHALGGNDTVFGGGGNDIIYGGTGNDTLYGDAGNDQIYGEDGDDTLYGGANNDLLNGGNGTDTVVQEGNTNMTLTNTTLTGDGTDTLVSIEIARLTGGNGPNTLDASAFSGQVFLNGLGGNDTLRGGSGDDFLDGGLGNDNLYGGGGTDTVVQTANVDMTLTNTQLTGQGTDSLNSIEQAILTGGAGNNTLDASTFSGQVYLYGLAGNDILRGGSGDDFLDGGEGNDALYGGAGTDTVVQTANANMTLSDTQLTGQGTDSLNSIERAILTGGAGNNTLNASDFSGSVVLNGMDGNDTLLGGAGDDTLDGGDGTDTVVQTVDADMILTNTSLTGMGNDTLISIEQANLTGGASDNLLNASAFSGPVFLYGMGGNDTLMGGAGNDTLDGGDGTDTVVQTVNANMTLTDDSLTGMGTDSLDSIERAELIGGAGNNKLDASAFSGQVVLSGMGGDDTLMGGEGDDTLDGGDGTDTVVQTIDNDMTLTDTSLTGMGNDTLISIEIAALTGGASDNLLDASAFSGQAFLYGMGGDDTLMGGAGNDTLDGGDGVDTVEQTADVDMTLTDTSLTGMGLDTLISIEMAVLTGGAGNNILNALGFSGPVILNGGAGDDTLIGGAGDDELVGGDGTDTVVQEVDADMILTDDSLTGMGTDYLDSIERARLIGGAGNNTIDASGFSGQAYLDGGDGDDTLVGGDGDDTIIGGNGNDTITTSSGQDTITGGEGDDTFLFSGETGSVAPTVVSGGGGFNLFKFLTGASGRVELDTTSDEDTLDFSEYDGAVVIDLALLDVEQNVGYNAAGEDLFITLKGWFKRLIGSAFDDVLLGNDLENEIYGGPGDDQLDGGGGHDLLDGGPGTDTDLDKGDGDTWVNMELPLDPVDDDDDDDGMDDDGGGTSTAQFLVTGLIPVTGTLQPLICDAGSNVAVLTTLTGDKVYFKNLCGMQAIVQPAASLPALLPEGRQMVSALSIVIADGNGKVLQELPQLASLTVAFKQNGLVNGGAQTLFWNGTGWLTLDAQSNEGFIEVNANQGGLYVLTNR
jgi:Ca2+-binding RTX toxin-like protein